MGMVTAEMHVRPRDAAALERLRKEVGEVQPSPSGFVCALSEGRSIAWPRSLRDLGTRQWSSQYGEAVYVMMYDGPAGEICGTFLYEHSIEGQVQRAVGWTRALDDEAPPGDAPQDPEELYWRRAEGEPEPWEGEVVRKGLDEALQLHCVDMPQWNDLPPLPPEEVERLRQRWSRLIEGEVGPKLNEYTLYGAVHAYHGLPAPPR